MQLININTFKYHVFCTDGKFQLELIYLYFPPSSHLLYVTSTPTRPVDNVVITTKGLQDRNIHIIDGTTVESKGKLIHGMKTYRLMEIDTMKKYYLMDTRSLAAGRLQECVVSGDLHTCANYLEESTYCVHVPLWSVLSSQCIRKLCALLSKQETVPSAVLRITVFKVNIPLMIET